MPSFPQNKIFSLKQLSQLVQQWKSEGTRVAFTNGVFDLLHLGHIAYLNDAASLADKLVVAINADKSVKTLEKGPARPIKDEKSRAGIMAALEMVSAVVIFKESTPLKLIKILQPDILIKGGDYDASETNPMSKKYIVGRAEVLAYKGEVKVIPFLEGYSSTALEKKILRAHNCDKF